MTARLYEGLRKYWVNIYIHPNTLRERTGAGLFLTEDAAKVSAYNSKLKLLATVPISYEVSFETMAANILGINAIVENYFIPGW